MDVPALGLLTDELLEVFRFYVGEQGGADVLAQDIPWAQAVRRQSQRLGDFMPIGHLGPGIKLTRAVNRS